MHFNPRFVVHIKPRKCQSNSIIRPKDPLPSGFFGFIHAPGTKRS